MSRAGRESVYLHRRSAPFAALLAVIVLIAGLSLPARGQGEVPTFVIPPDPPRADLIDFGPLDDLGQATVTGSPGAVVPEGVVQLVNLDTGHQAFVAEADTDGSFSTEIFAPPGSNIFIRHGPQHDLWETAEDGGAPAGLTVFPSTTIHRPRHHEAGHPSRLAFATAGATGVDDAVPTSIDAGWSLTGTVGPVKNLRVGDVVEVEGTVRLYSNGIDDTHESQLEAISLGIETRELTMVFDPEGNPLAQANQPGSSRLTPSGLPILDGRRPEVSAETQSAEVGPWRFVGDHAMEADVSVRIELRDDMPPGVYRPVLLLHFGGAVPEHDGWTVGSLLFHQGWSSLTLGPIGGALPPLRVKHAAGPPTDRPPTDRSDDDVDEGRRLVWRLLMDTTTLGTRGAGAREDVELFQPASFVATQGADYVLPPVDPYTGQPVAYRLEPHLPMISYGRGAAPDTPLIPFDLPGGELCVSVERPDGTKDDLGCDEFAQSMSGDPSTRGGRPLNFGAVEVSEAYGLTTNDDDFVVVFEQPGHHEVRMEGWVRDVWGTRYEGGGTYDIWVAHPLDLDPGILPGTPVAVGDAINPALQLQPGVPAEVSVTVEHLPYSDPTRREVHRRQGRANGFGYFAPPGPPIRLHEPGEYRVDVSARYTNPNTGEMWAGSITWGSVVMTPPEESVLATHGRRGMDNADLPTDIFDDPLNWFFLCELGAENGSTPHAFNPYLNGDVLWSRSDLDLHAVYPGCQGDALILGGSVEDLSVDGSVEKAIVDRWHRNGLRLPPGLFDARVQAGELPLFSSTASGRAPALVPGEMDQVAYAYLSSQRPGIRVRETISEDPETSGYWRVDGMFDGQPGVGPEGDLPNDFKYQFVGIVYRDLQTGLIEYGGQATGWIHTTRPEDPDEPMAHSRVMPPFPGPGNGGWRPCGGPLMTLFGEEIHQFILPTAVGPGTVLEVGDRFDFSGHIMPTLPSRVEVEVTGPSGSTHVVSGRANKVGYFHDPGESFDVDEPGVWTADVRVWHDGAIGSGDVVDCNPDDPFDPDRPCPSGDILGSHGGTYEFFVVPGDAEDLAISQPGVGPLTFAGGIQPIEVSGPIPDGVEGATVDYVITMPGLLLERGQATVLDGMWTFTFDPVGLQGYFPNLDLTGLHTQNGVGLADTFTLSAILSGDDGGGAVHRAAHFTIQGDLVQRPTG